MKLLRRVLVVVVLLLVAGYFGIPWLVGTSWAREKVKSAMARETGRQVELGDISFGWFSGLTVKDVSVAQKKGQSSADGPLFELGALKLDVGISHLLAKKIVVKTLTVEKARIVIIRDQNGRFNFSDLLGKPSESKQPGPTVSHAPSPLPSPGKAGTPSSSGTGGPHVVANVDIEDGTILYVDEPLGSRIELKNIQAKATWNDGKLDLSLDSELNGGQVKVRATADLSRSPAPYQVSDLTIEGARFDSNLAALGIFLPLAGDSPQKASGTLSFHVSDLTGKGLDLERIRKSLTAKGDLTLKGGALVSGPVTQLYGALDKIGAGDLSALGSSAGAKELAIRLLTSTFAIEDGKVETKDMKVKGAGIDLALTGYTSLAGDLHYQVVASALTKLIQKNDRLKQALGDQQTIPLVLEGTLSDPKITLEPGSLIENAAKNLIEKELRGKLPGGIRIPIPGGGK